MDMDGKVEFSAFYLPDPYRLVLDLPEVNFKINTKTLKKTADGIEGYRFGLFEKGTSRVVIDLAKPMVIVKSFQLEPNSTPWRRLVVDLKPVTRNAFMIKSAGSIQTRSTKRSFNANSKQQLSLKKVKENILNKKIIVIDPGHGGVDPGAVGASGTYEKHVVLSAAVTFKKIIEDGSRYKVVLTRQVDKFLPLRKRISLSRLSGADLFISIHADSIGKKSIRGATIYTLSETASDKEAAQLAEQENKSDIIAGMDLSDESKEVTDILIDLAQRETMNQSAHFAGLLVPELTKVLKTHRRPHKFAGFAVLKAPDVPSILLEMGYLSNVNDERLLKTQIFQRKLGKALRRGLDKYFFPVK